MTADQRKEIAAKPIGAIVKSEDGKK